MAFIPERFHSMEAYTDEQIVAAVLQGQIEMYELLMRRYNQRLFRAARAILKDEAEAEDVMQEAYVRAYAKLSAFRGESSFATWLTRIAVYEALGRAKRRGLIEPIENNGAQHGFNTPFSSSAFSPEEVAAQEQLKAALEAAIDTLPLLYRSIFVLRYVEGLSIRQTAECLDITEETARMRLHRARALMRRYFRERLGITTGELFPLRNPQCDRVVNGVFQRLNMFETSG